MRNIRKDCEMQAVISEIETQRNYMATRAAQMAGRIAELEAENTKLAQRIAELELEEELEKSNGTD